MGPVHQTLICSLVSAISYFERMVLVFGGKHGPDLYHPFAEGIRLNSIILPSKIDKIRTIQ